MISKCVRSNMCNFHTTSAVHNWWNGTCCNNIYKRLTSVVAEKFVEHVKELFMEQRSDIEKAIAGLGEYHLTSTYQNLGVETKHWFMKSEPQRKRTIAKFMNANLAESFDPQMGMKAASTASSSAEDGESGSEECSLPSKDNALRTTALPQYTQDSMVQRYLCT